MTPITFTKEELVNPDEVLINAVLRIKDFSGFFDRHNRRLSAMLSVADNCAARPMFVATEPEVIIALRRGGYYGGGFMNDKKWQNGFNRELVRVALLLEKLALMIDPKAVIEMDFPPIDYIAGKNLYPFDMIKEEFTAWVGEDVSPMNLSYVIPKELNRKIDAYLDMVIPPKNQMLGTCHWIWGMKKTILRYGFNLDWETPSERYPRAIFD